MLASQGVMQAGIERHGFDARIAQLISGEVDAISGYSTNEPFMFRRLGHEVNLIQPGHYGFDLYGDMLFTSRQEAENKPERVAVVKRAVPRGWEYALANKNELEDLIYRQYNTQSKNHEALMHEALDIESLIARHTNELVSLDQGRVDHLVNHLQSLELLAHADTSEASLKCRSASNKGFELPPEERMFLETLDPVRFGAIEEGWPPFEFLHDGEFQGIASDYLTKLGALLDINFKLITQREWEETLQRARDREIDVLPVAASTPNRPEYMRFTLPYVRSPMIVVTRNDVDFIPSLTELEDKEVSVVGGHASNETLARHYPNIDSTTFPSAHQGLLALASGDIYAFVENLAATSHIIKSEGLTNLKISGQTPYNFNP